MDFNSDWTDEKNVTILTYLQNKNRNKGHTHVYDQYHVYIKLNQEFHQNKYKTLQK